MAVTSCRIMIDTSIAWVMALDDGVGRALRSFLGKSTGACIVGYSEALLREARTAASPNEYRLILSVVKGLAREPGPGIEVLRRLASTKTRAVRKLEVYDVMIVLAAVASNSVLMTGDWAQASYFMSVSGMKPLYVPLLRLAGGAGR